MDEGSKHPVTVFDINGTAIASTPCPTTGNLITDVLNAAAPAQQRLTSDEEAARVSEGLRLNTAFRAATGGSHALAQLGRDAIALIFSLQQRLSVAEGELLRERNRGLLSRPRP